MITEVCKNFINKQHAGNELLKFRRTRRYTTYNQPEPGCKHTSDVNEGKVEDDQTFASVKSSGLAILSLVIIPWRPLGREDVK